MEFVKAPRTSWLDGLIGYTPWVQLAVMVLVLGFLGWVVFRLLRKRRGLKVCHWRMDGNRSGMRRWRCSVCGVDAFSKGRRPPKECKRALKPVGL